METGLQTARLSEKNSEVLPQARLVISYRSPSSVNYPRKDPYVSILYDFLLCVLFICFVLAAWKTSY